MQQVREPAVAGMFYPANEQKLRTQLELLFDVSSGAERVKNAFGVIVPHAGYIYSGKTAAYGFSTVKDNSYDTIVVISPSHREYFSGISIYNGDAYKTPLGLIPVNKDMRSKLCSSSEMIFEGMEGHGNEHALEVELPFLQYMYKDFSLVPIVIGDQRKIFVDELAESLSETVDEKTLIVASSDLSHFYTKEQADELDSKVAKRIENFEYEQLQDDLENETCFACGGGGIVSLMTAARQKGFNKTKIVHRSDSGDTSGDNREVVGYLSAVVYG